MGPEPHEPHPPPQHPPPLDSLAKSDADGSPPATAKLETRTRVFVDSHAGQICAESRSAKRVSTSNFPAQLSHRYS